MIEATSTWWERLSDWGWNAFLTLASGVVAWVFHIERKIAGLRLHVAENYVKKSDLTLLESRLEAQFSEVKESQGQILDILLQRKIGTTSKRR